MKSRPSSHRITMTIATTAAMECTADSVGSDFDGPWTLPHNGRAMGETIRGQFTIGQHAVAVAKGLLQELFVNVGKCSSGIHADQRLVCEEGGDDLLDQNIGHRRHFWGPLSSGSDGWNVFMQDG